MPQVAAPISENVHGTTIAVAGCAALLRGPSGSGKSDLALRCLALSPGPLLAAAPQLVADDRTIVTLEAGRIRVSAPQQLAGLIEVRGVGILRVPAVTDAILALVVDLVPPGEIERFPVATPPTILSGRAVPCLRLTPFEASAPLKLVLALAKAAESRKSSVLPGGNTG